MFVLLNILWFVWELKYILFWFYLWQLKEYHLGRFIDHFRTHKGKKLLFNFIQIIKLVLLVFLLVDNNLFVYLSSLLFLVYLAELVIIVRAFFIKSIKKPVFTFKIKLLGGISFIVLVLSLLYISSMRDVFASIYILSFDILTPIIVSLIVLSLQPIAVLIRNNNLEKARKKLETIKSVNNLKVIAITGSYGKTSTKEFLYTILSKKFNVLKTKDHQNSEAGIAKTILENLKPEHQIFIAEVGAYNRGKVKEVCSVLKPDIGIVTGVNEQHLSLFRSLENLLSAEGGGELEKALPKDGLLILNGDNKYCLDLYKKTETNKKLYNMTNKVISSDIWSDSITVHKNHISFLVINKLGEMSHFNVRVLGKQNVQNLLAVILTASELGMSFAEISEACVNISEKQAGTILKHGKHEIEIIDSSYSANPDGVFADLDYLSIFPKKKIIIMPCLIELGNKSSQIHQKIGQKIGQICDLAIITSKDQFKEIKMGAMGSGMEEKNIVLCDNPQDIYSIVTLLCGAQDVVLLEGRVPENIIKLLET